jgi:tetratricopeptide (TPR) repeat protein
VAKKTSVASGAALLAFFATSIGCTGGLPSLPWSNRTASTAPSTSNSQLAGAQTAPKYGKSTESGGISQALWDNPVSRAVKNAFSDDVMPTGYSAAGVAASDPISLSYPQKPPTASLYVAMGQVAEQSGDKEKAREFYEKALAIGPKDADALTAYGRFEDRQGRLAEATALYRRALESDPQHAGAYNDLGLCYARQGQYPQALELVRQAARLNPDRPIYRNNVARVLVEMGHSEEALHELSGVFPPEEAHYNVGWFLTQTGRNNEAAAYFAAALQYNPQMEQARAWLAKIQPSHVAAAGSGSYQAQVTQQPLAQGAAAGGRLPIITNVRSVPEGDAGQSTSIASLPRANAASTWPANPAAGGSATWSQEPQAPAWSQSQQPFATSGTAQDRYEIATPQTPASAAQQAAPAGLEALMQAPGNTPKAPAAPFSGQSHESPWGNVPSPYQGSQLTPSGRSQDAPAGGATLQYPASVAFATGSSALSQQPGTPETFVNPFVSGATIGSHDGSQVRQASAEMVQP